MKAVVFKPIFLLFICFAVTEGAVHVQASDCDKYFQNEIFPIPKIYSNHRNLVKLCQNEQTNAGVNKSAVFATLFNTAHKIPVYSANRINMTDSYNKPRPDGRDLWKRVASSLCSRHGMGPLLSRIKKMPFNRLGRCEKKQAVNRDYVGQGLTKGHLEPSNMNNDDEYKQNTTFTLTNVAPQYGIFNRGSWEKIECLVRELIYNLTRDRFVYVVTGVSGWAKDNNGRGIKLKNRVRVPDSFWKAVCFPSDAHQDAWSFAIEIKNENKFGPQNKTALLAEMKDLKLFMKKIFKEGDSPFGDACLNATLQPAMQHFQNFWDSLYKNKCGIKN